MKVGIDPPGDGAEAGASRDSSSPFLEGDGWISKRHLEQAIWAFVGLGVTFRLVRYLFVFPLSRDEAKLASSWLDRGFLQMVEPLDYGQVAPVAFLWANLAVVRQLGFTELSLRLLPFLLGIGSLLLIRRLGNRVAPGVPALLAVALLAVSYYPIRLATEAKPYTTDLFVALVLTLLAVEAWRQPRRLRWLALLTIVSCIAILASYPSVFIIGGAGLALLPTIVRTRDRRVWLAWLAFAAASFGTFLLSYLRVTRAQYQESLVSAANLEFWSRSFPPTDSLWGMLEWFFFAHTGRTFAYPVGASHGGSSLTFALFILGAVWLYRTGRRTLLAILLLPFVLLLAAAMLRLYPYGGSGRISQHLVPAICLLAGLGLAWMISLRGDVVKRRRTLAWALAVLAVVGTAITVRYTLTPYQDEPSSLEAQEFARGFWQEASEDAELICAVVDSAANAPYRGQLPHLHRYWSNQRIYFERHQRGEPPRWGRVSADHPLRVAVPVVVIEPAADAALLDPDPARTEAIRGSVRKWLEELELDYRRVGFERLRVEGRRIRGAREEVYVELYELVPRAGSAEAESGRRGSR